MGDPHIFNTKHRFAKSSSHLLSANPWRPCSGEWSSTLLMTLTVVHDSG